MLDEAVAECLQQNQTEAARKAISAFLAGVGNDRDRSRYITQLADGAFSYYAFAAAPEVAERLRNNLRPLTIFLDTNFIFGLIKLGESVWSDITEELVELSRGEQLPFTLVYHERTDREVQGTIVHYESFLKSCGWDTPVARAALKSPSLPGVIRQYLERFLATGIGVETYFRPYKHIEELLKAQGVSMYPAPANRDQQRATLFQDYKNYLDSRGKRKTHNPIEHDATLLDTVRMLRREARSSLDAGAVLLTYDYYLYRFDWESGRALGLNPCAALPNSFWQILRPFVSRDDRFDRSFAETFALPEFRTVGSDSAQAVERLLQVVTSFEDIPEATAARLLTNDLLLESLRKIEEPERFREIVESAIAAENALLVERQEILRTELEEGTAALGAVEGEVEKERKGRERAVQKLRQREEEVATLETTLRRKLAQEEESRREAEEALGAERIGRERFEKSYNWMKRSVIGALFLSTSVVCGFWPELFKAEWLEQHSRQIAIRALAALGVFIFGAGFLWPRHRNLLWFGSGGALVVLVLLLTLL